MSHIRMSHFAHMDASCHTYGGVTSHTYASHVARVSVSCRTYGWVLLHTWMSHECCCTHKWVMSRHMDEWCCTWMSHIAHMDITCHKHSYLLQRFISATRVLWILSGIRHKKIRPKFAPQEFWKIAQWIYLYQPVSYGFMVPEGSKISGCFL